ncbi:hypothetical protein AXG93_3491s1050 [Marchantia polymorpha subsp. ruderalis]|uniref:Uncharacterized protein n=1 Tax=Marchantia polymorpha subsp. ruderalis TaxID=1480154 RepID=A0A176VQX2_MARPO|nr:hypothetical protein AXG93_3491s1050 [Marchantia polymorpha subsp. ruderalis]
MLHPCLEAPVRQNDGGELDGSTAMQTTADDMVNQEDTVHNVLLELHEVKVHVDRLYRDQQVFVDAADAMLVGAVLISSVTFGGWLQFALGIHRMSKDAQSQEHQVSVKMANISDLDKREEQKIEVYALMAFKNTRVLEVDGFSGQLRRLLHSSQNPGYGHL